MSGSLHSPSKTTVLTREILESFATALRAGNSRDLEVETHLIEWALRTSHGNKSRAAELLRIKRSTLGDRIRRLGLDAP